MIDHLSPPRGQREYVPLNNRNMESEESDSLLLGLLVDLDENGKPIGIEITIPASVTTEAVNEILASYGFGLIDAVDLAPLKQAA